MTTLMAWWLGTVLVTLWVIWPAALWAVLYDSRTDNRDGDLRIRNGRMQERAGRRWYDVAPARRGEDWWGEELTFGGRVRIGDVEPTR